MPRPTPPTQPSILLRSSDAPSGRNTGDGFTVAHNMRAITYREHGEPSFLTMAERPMPEPGTGEVRVRMAVSGVNATDWKARRGLPIAFAEPLVEFPEMVPNQDGAGVVDALGWLPLHRFPLERAADAHAAVEAGRTGKVLIDVD